MSVHAAEKRSWGALGRMGVVAAMHVALGVVLATSFGLMPKIEKPPITEGGVIDEPPAQDDPPPSVGPGEMTQASPYVPPPAEVDFESDSTDGITAQHARPDETAGGAGPVIPVPETGVRTDPRHPLSQPNYPARRIRENVEGTVDLEVLVQTDGRVADARIARSSGYDDFDQATLDEARRHWQLVPATRNGQPIAQWYRMRVSFKLRNQQ